MKPSFKTAPGGAWRLKTGTVLVKTSPALPTVVVVLPSTVSLGQAMVSSVAASKKSAGAQVGTAVAMPAKPGDCSISIVFTESAGTI
jgi:hypothetical protein